MTINIEELENFIFQQALENALNYNGNANPKALIGKVMPKFPEIKNDMGTYMQKINNITEQVNSLSPQEQKEKIIEINPDFFIQKQEQKEHRQQHQQEEKHEENERQEEEICWWWW